MKLANVQTTKVYKKIIITFSIFAIIVIGLIIYFSLSKTVIGVTLNPQKKSTTFNVGLKKELTEEDKTSNYKMTGYLLQTVVSGSQEFINTNEGEEIEDQATGTVAIYNNWSKEQPLAATTRLLTPDGTLFRIKERVDVPAGGKIENVEVYADQPGSSGNIKPTKFTIPGLWKGLQDKIYAESSEPMTGGLRQLRFVTQDVINQAANSLRQELLKKAKADLEQTEEIKNSGDKVSEQALASIILEGNSSAEVGDEVDSFETNMKLRVMAVIFDENELLNLALNNFKTELPNDEMTEDYNLEDLTYSVGEYNYEDQTASLQVKFSALVVPRLSNPIFNRDSITGKDEQEIKAYFSNFDEIKNVTIKFSPFWVNKAPSLKDNIRIKIN